MGEGGRGRERVVGGGRVGRIVTVKYKLLFTMII